MLPHSLQGKLIFLFVTLILITNGFFAIVGFSRENIYITQEALQIAISIVGALEKPSQIFFRDGNTEQLDHIMQNRAGMAAELFLTIYDANWWHLWGDEARIPPEGFPDIEGLKRFDVRTGFGNTVREVFVPIIVDGQRCGAIGVGVPSFSHLQNRTSVSDFLSMLLISFVVGVSVAMMASKSLLASLYNLMSAVEDFGNGDYSVRVDPREVGELKDLACSFNRMALTVQETFKENLQRNRVIDEKLQELWEIYELMRKMSLNVEFKVILEKFLEKAQTLSFSSYGQIIFQDKHTLKLMMATDLALPAGIELHEFENAVNKCFIDGTVVEFSSHSLSAIFLPLLAGNKTNGVLFLAKNDVAGYSEGIRRFLETIAPVIASQIRNAKLYEELADWNQHLKNIMSSINSGLATVDRRSKFIVANENFFNIVGVSGFDLYTASFKDLCGRISDRAFASVFLNEVTLFNSAVNSEKSAEHRVHKILDCFCGENVTKIALNIMPLFSESEINGCIIVLLDVTEQKKIEQQMLESEKWAVLGRLAASVAHEIRNPLVAISSLVEIIGEEVQGDLKEHVGVILGEVQRLNRVVTELLGLARPEVANLKERDLVEVINELLLLVRHEAAKNEIKLERHFPDEPCKIFVDAEKIKQAVLNILLNSFQTIGRGGCTGIEIRKSPEGVIIVVYNDGPVIPEKMRARIFEPFFTTRVSGTGLGLAITRKVIDLHNGKIEVESREGHTEFKILLPIGEKHAQNS